MESLTYYQANRTRVGVRTVRRGTAGPGMESLTSCQANRMRVGVRTVRRDTAGPGMESLTYCQANRTRVGVRTVRRDTAGLGMESLTGYQVNRNRVKRRTVSSEIVMLLYASNLVWHPAQYLSFQICCVKMFCVDTVQLFTIYSTHPTIPVYSSYLLTAYSIFSTMLACCVDITSFCNSFSSSASAVPLKSGVQSAPS